MTASTLITDYAGRGTLAARPVTPNVPTGGTAIYYATDTLHTFIWSGAAWVQIDGATSLISTQTASASASLAWTGLATATAWRLIGNLLVPATNSTGLAFVVGTGGTPTYVTSGYNFALTLFSSANSSASFGAEAQASAALNDGTGANAAPGTSFDILITTDNATFVMYNGTTIFRGQTSHYRSGAIGGDAAVAAAITAIKITEASGNITSGSASLYSMTV